MFKSRNKMLMSICIVLFLFSIVSAYSGGTGTQADPYQIANAADLLELAANTADYNKCFILTADIDLAGQVFTKSIIVPLSFTGVFDGNDHKITNFTIDGGNNNYIGLFGYVGLGGSVKNLGLENFTVSGKEYVGGLAGYCRRGSINNCYATGSVSGDDSVGGLVGENSGSISNCYVTGTVSGERFVGGLVGFNEYGHIANCYATGAVTGEYVVGGLVGTSNYESNITSCYATGSVSGAEVVGGLMGDNCESIVTNNCYATGTVSGENYVGGLVGYNYESNVTNCYATGTVSGKNYVGGLVGRNDEGAVTASFWNIETSGQATSAGGEGKTTAQMHSIGTFCSWACGEAWTIDDGNDYPRLVWQNLPGQLITLASAYGGGSGTTESPLLIYTPQQLNAIGLLDCALNMHFKLMSDIDLSGFPEGQFNIIGKRGPFTNHPFTGVFDGNGHTISNLTVDLTIDIKEGSYLYYIGLFGYTGPNSLITNLGVEDVNMFVSTNQGTIYIGGLVGKNVGSVENCYVTGIVNGNGAYITQVGGLVGYNDGGGSITNCYNSAEVDSDYCGGGLVGQNGGYQGGGIITNCYNTGAVSGGGSVGGMVGWNDGCENGGLITNCYNTGAVNGSGGWGTGGLVGTNYDYFGSIENCYSTGAVNGSSRVGGLIGDNYGSSILNCYASGAVTGENDVGGLVGCNWSGSVISSFWDIETSGQTSSAGGTGKTTAEMKNINTFLNAGWDFDYDDGDEDIWTICDGITYPTFVWQNAQPIADAGNDQAIYLYIDEGVAEVELDGSASSDIDECGDLSYHWTWTIDANTYGEVNSVNPVIELPVGIHTIELIVNDGIADSEPNYVDVNVIAPLETDLRIMPKVVNRASKNRNIIAVMDMPKGIKKGDISKEPFVLYPADGEEGIEAVRQYVLPYGRQRVRVFVLFDKDDLIDLIPDNGRVKLQVVGELNSGQYIFGEDDIWLIGKRRPLWPWRWRKW